MQFLQGQKSNTQEVPFMKKLSLLAAACLMISALAAQPILAQDERKAIGEKEEGSAAITLTNETGRDISAFRIRSTEESDFSDNMMEEGDVFADGESRIFFYAPEIAEEQEYTEEDFAAADAKDGTEEDLPDDKVLTVGYDIQITFADDDSTAEINAFPFEGMEEGAIRAEDGVAFLVYADKNTGEEVNTKEYALSILKQAQDAIKAAEEAAARAQAAAANTGSSAASYSVPSYTAPAASVPTYSDPGTLVLMMACSTIDKNAKKLPEVSFGAVFVLYDKAGAENSYWIRSMKEEETR